MYCRNCVYWSTNLSNHFTVGIRLSYVYVNSWLLTDYLGCFLSYVAYWDCPLVKVSPQQAEVAQGVPGSLRPLVFLTFGTTRVVGCQTYAPVACTPGEIPGTHFQRLSLPQGTWFRRWEPREKSQVTRAGIVPGTVRLVAQCLNHYATPGLLEILLVSGKLQVIKSRKLHSIVIHTVEFRSFCCSCFIGQWHICGRILLPQSCWQHRHNITQSQKFWRIFRWKLRNLDFSFMCNWGYTGRVH